MTDPNQYAGLFPRMFDGIDTQLKKVQILALVAQQLDDEGEY